MTATAALVTSGIAQGIVALLEAYRLHTDKPEGWIPTETDWAELEAFAAKTPAMIKEEAAKRLNVPWPPPAEQDTPQAPPGN